MSLEIYKIIHLMGVFMVIGGLSAYAAASAMCGAEIPQSRRIFGLVHGFGMGLSLLGGFGLLARMGIHGDWPGWVFVKLIVWLALGAIMAPVKRSPKSAKLLWGVMFALVFLNVYVTIAKPF